MKMKKNRRQSRRYEKRQWRKVGIDEEEEEEEGEEGEDRGKCKRLKEDF